MIRLLNHRSRIHMYVATYMWIRLRWFSSRIITKAGSRGFWGDQAQAPPARLRVNPVLCTSTPETASRRVHLQVHLLAYRCISGQHLRSGPRFSFFQWSPICLFFSVARNDQNYRERQRRRGTHKGNVMGTQASVYAKHMSWKMVERFPTTQGRTPPVLKAVLLQSCAQSA
jgi:hypothetical protein